MLLQRLATGAIGVKPARYASLPTDYSPGLQGTRTRMRSLYTSIYHDTAILLLPLEANSLRPEPASENSAEGLALYSLAYN